MSRHAGVDGVDPPVVADPAAFSKRVGRNRTYEDDVGVREHHQIDVELGGGVQLDELLHRPAPDRRVRSPEVQPGIDARQGQHPTW